MECPSCAFLPHTPTCLRFEGFCPSFSIENFQTTLAVLVEMASPASFLVCTSHHSISLAPSDSSTILLFSRSFKNRLQSWSISCQLSPSGLLVLLQSSSNQQKQWKVSWVAWLLVWFLETVIHDFCTLNKN